MVDTFAPGVEPSVEYGKTVKYRTLDADFGEGYSQRTKDGLNSKTVEPALYFAAVSSSIKDYIEGFLDEKGGAEAFSYTLPDESDPKLWICKEPDYQHLGAGLWRIDMKLKQVFDLV